MKGRRKAKTLKWQMKAVFEAEARAKLLTRSAKQARFLELSVGSGKMLEPIGLLAG